MAEPLIPPPPPRAGAAGRLLASQNRRRRPSPLPLPIKACPPPQRKPRSRHPAPTKEEPFPSARSVCSPSPVLAPLLSLLLAVLWSLQRKSPGAAGANPRRREGLEQPAVKQAHRRSATCAAGAASLLCRFAATPALRVNRALAATSPLTSTAHVGNSRPSGSSQRLTGADRRRAQQQEGRRASQGPVHRYKRSS